MARIKIGQIGTGHAHAAGKMAVYRASTDYEVIGIVEPDPSLRERAQAQPEYREVRWMTQEELLNVPGLQAVAIETRVKDLLPAAEASLSAGKHIHLDKPAGASLPHFRKVLDIAASKHLTVQMGYMYRYNPGVVFLRDALRKGWLGEPFEVHAVMSKVIDTDQRAQLAEFAGGMLFELGCHLIDLVVAIAGEPSSVSPFKQHAGPFEDRLADNMLAVFTYPKALATVKSSAMEVEGFARRHLVVCGTEGTCHIEPLDAPRARLALGKPREKYKVGYQDIPFGDYPRYVADAADLARIIRDEKESDYPYSHDLAVQKAVLRASGMALT